MTRTEWKDFMHSLRSDARAFKAEHGGHPYFVRYFTHNGHEITVTRYRDFGTIWKTYTRQSIIRRRPIASLVLDELDAAATHRKAATGNRHNPHSQKTAARIALKIAREWRLEQRTGWKDAA